jgi:hypothetical protein
MKYNAFNVKPKDGQVEITFKQKEQFGDSLATTQETTVTLPKNLAEKLSHFILQDGTRLIKNAPPIT